MFKEDTYIEVYTEFDNSFYLPTMVKNGIGYVAEKVNDNGEVNPVFIPWSDVKYINRISSVFKTGKLKFGDEFREEVYKQLKIDIKKESKYYSREKIEYMIINSNDEYIEEILNIKDLGILQTFVAILTALENTNEYNISNKVATYIRARHDELVEGIKKSEFTVVPSRDEEKKAELEEILEESNEELEEKSNEEVEKKSNEEVEKTKVSTGTRKTSKAKSTTKTKK